jgi:thiol:disulfide interchange protein DsbD
VAAAGGQPIAFQARVLPFDPFSDFNERTPPKGKKLEVRRGETFLLVLTGTLEKGWHTYPLTERAPEQSPAGLSKVTIDGGANFQPVYPVRESKPGWHDGRKDAKDVEDVYLEHARPFTWEQEVYVKPTAPAGKAVELPVKIRVQVCSNACKFEDHVLKVEVNVAPGTPVEPSAALKKRLEAKQPAPAVVPLPKEIAERKFTAGPPAAGGPAPGGNGGGLIASVAAAVVGGLVSLATPCVFPMIPITVSFFLKQSERRKVADANGTPNGPAPHNPVLLAGIYSGTIALVLVAGGLLLGRFLQEVSNSPITNSCLGALFLFFALSLLGMYDITLPSWLQDRTAAGENKGGVVGVFFMALTFSIISFACVGPIYGAFVGVQATQAGSGGWRILPPVVAYSVVFASPFFLLALFPSLLQTLPKSGSWMNTVKVVLGFLEVAAAVKFLRAAEKVLPGGARLLSFDLALGIYVALSVACALYLLGVYRLPHDHDAPETVGVPRLLFGLAFLTLAVYLLPGLFKTAAGDGQRPGGRIFAWTESFLLPEDEQPVAPGSKPAPGASDRLEWQSNLPAALAQARRESKLVFLDFTGQVCTNCRLNERDVFTRPNVKAALAQLVLVRLYCEAGVPSSVTDQQPDSPGAIKLRESRFGSSSLPLYAVVRPTPDGFEVVAKDEQGLITDVPAFLKFLDTK